MKTTIEIPDELYRLVKAKSALEGRAVREVTVELYRRYVGEGPGAPQGPPPGNAAIQWLDEWIALADKTMPKAARGLTAREQLARDRGRLDKG